MSWTQDTPIQEGAYWFRRAKHKPRQQVTVKGDKVVFESGDTQNLGDVKGQWRGPIVLGGESHNEEAVTSPGKAIIDGLRRISPILGAIVTLFYFGFPLSSWADQYGSTVGNLSLTLAGLLLLALLFMGIDEAMIYFRMSGWKLLLVKNGVRAILLLIVSLPLIGFKLDPTVTTASTHAYPYEAGKKLRIDLYLANKNAKEKWVKGTYRVFLTTSQDRPRQTIEDELWAVLMSTNDKLYIDFPVPLANVNPRVEMEGPVLTAEQVNRLKDKTMVIYFMGVIRYYEWYGLPRKIEFCGSYLDDTRFMIMCDKHSKWSGSEKLRPNG